MSQIPNPRTMAAVMLDPFRYFDDPMDVVADKSMTKEEKLTVLRAMEADARELDVASEENMAGGEKRDLGAILNALRAIDPQAAERREQAGGSANKHH